MNFACVAAAVGLMLGCGGSGKQDVASPERSASRSVAARPPKEPAKETEPLPEVVARASLVPMVSSIKPGKPFWLALHLDIHPGYRVSWTYAGDVGRDIRVQFSAPDDFEVGEVVYPAPARFSVQEFHAFGWQDEAAAFVQIVPPRRISSREAYRFDVKADWLACKKECLRESSQAYVELTSSWSGGQKVDAPELWALFERVPAPFSETKSAKAEWVKSGRRHRVRLSVEGVALEDFIPASETVRKAVTSVVEEKGHSLSLDYDSPPEPPPHTTKGILVGKQGDRPVSYRVELSWLDEDAEPKRTSRR